MAGTNASASDPNIATGKAAAADIRRKKKSPPCQPPLAPSRPRPLSLPL